MATSPSRLARSIVLLLGCVALVAIVVWWQRALATGALPGADHTWLRQPALGVDFFTEPDYAARLWRGGIDPYENERHLFHYPPIVIRLFLWTPYFTVGTALRIWMVVLAALIAIATALASRTRRLVGAGELPFVPLLALVLVSFPVVFQLERSNFDLIALAAILLAVPLLERNTPLPEFLAGALLAFGPWVKIYPGLMLVAVAALRRFTALAGFVVGGVVIGAVTPAETLRSFEVLRIAISRAKTVSHDVPFATWSHSLSIAWLRIGLAAEGTPLGKVLTTIPGSVVAGLLVLLPLAWVCLRVFRARDASALTFPLLLWTVSLGSFVPEIANDYSLAFLPIAAASVIGKGDSLLVRALFVASLVALQPIALPIPGSVLLVPKVCCVLAVGLSIADRAGRLSQGGSRRQGVAALADGASPPLADGTGAALADGTTLTDGAGTGSGRTSV
ncbi:MAG TPA: glycosyltransferase 87 family protein [Polyangiaceae bacterium]